MMSAILEGLEWAWRKREWRGHIVSMLFSSVLALGGYYYFSMKHNEAMAGIRDTKDSLVTSIDRIDKNVQDLYGYVILKRLPASVDKAH